MSDEPKVKMTYPERIDHVPSRKTPWSSLLSLAPREWRYAPRQVPVVAVATGEDALRALGWDVDDEPAEEPKRSEPLDVDADDDIEW